MLYLTYLKLNKTKTTSDQKGFITLEVIVSIAVALAFLMLSFQSIVYAMAIKVQAQEKQKANELIAEDIERMSRLGSNNSLGGVCNPVNYAGGYAQSLWNVLEPNSPSASFPPPTKSLIKTINNDGTDDEKGKTLALQRFHFDTNAMNNPPFRTLKVGYRVWRWDTATSSFIDRNGGAIDSNDEPIAETFVEVIPDDALSCP